MDRPRPGKAEDRPGNDKCEQRSDNTGQAHGSTVGAAGSEPVQGQFKAVVGRGALSACAPQAQPSGVTRDRWAH